MIDVNILLTQLNNTGLQNKNTPLYQFLKSLIDSLKSTQDSVTASSGTTTVTHQTIINSFGADGRDGLDGESTVIITPAQGTPFVENETPSGLVNSSNTVFTTAHQYQPGQLLLYLNGVRQKITIDYTETTSTSFTFVVAPTTGDILLVDYGVLTAAIIGPQGIQGATGPQGIPGVGLVAQDGLDGDSYLIPGPPGPALVAAAAKVYRSTNQTISSGAETAISLNTEVYDTNSFWTIISPTIFTIPSFLGGKYIVVGQVKWSISGSGAGYIRIYQNGILVGESYTQLVDTNSTLNVACQVSVVPGDTLEMRVFQSTGSNQTAVGGTGTYFSLEIAAGNGGQQAAASVPSGLVLLEEHTASSSSLLAFNTRNATGQSGATFQSDYDEYMIEFISLLQSVNASGIQMQVSTNGGSTYDATNYNMNRFFTWTSSGTGPNNTTFIGLADVINNTVAFGGICGYLRICNPNSSTIHKGILGHISYHDTNVNTPALAHVTGRYTATNAINAFKVYPVSGTLVSGTVRVYGLSQ